MSQVNLPNKVVTIETIPDDIKIALDAKQATFTIHQNLPAIYTHSK